MTGLEALFSDVTVGQPQTHNNLKIYPLHRKNGHARGYRTLEEALTTQEVVVKEVSEGGRVPTLSLENKSQFPLLIVVGEELIGARQNRVLNTSLLVPTESELPIPVSCVEQGRWGYTSRQFASGQTVSHYALRKIQTEKVTDNLRARAAYDADQGAVWQEVTRKISSHQTPSNTGALHDMYVQTEERLKGYLDALKPVEAQGILVAINGQIVGADVFDHAETTQTLWHKLVKSYAIDAMERADAVQASDAEDNPQHFWLDVKAATLEAYDSVGLGKDMRLTGEAVSGSLLLWNDQLVHASLFSKQHSS